MHRCLRLPRFSRINITVSSLMEDNGISRVVNLGLAWTICEISSPFKKSPSWQSSVHRFLQLSTTSTTALLPETVISLGGAEKCLTFLSLTIFGKHSLKDMRVPVKFSLINSSLHKSRILANTPLLMAVPVNIRLRNLLSSTRAG